MAVCTMERKRSRWHCLFGPYPNRRPDGPDIGVEVGVSRLMRAGVRFWRSRTGLCPAPQAAPACGDLGHALRRVVARRAADIYVLVPAQAVPIVAVLVAHQDVDRSSRLTPVRLRQWPSVARHVQGLSSGSATRRHSKSSPCSQACTTRTRPQDMVSPAQRPPSGRSWRGGSPQASTRLISPVRS